MRSAGSVTRGLELAREWAGESGTVVVVGSVFLAAKVLEILGIQDPESSSQENDKEQGWEIRVEGAEK